jgi:hypothetical protein
MAQNQLPIYNKQDITIQKDWFLDDTNSKAQLYQTTDGKLVLSNGLVSRIFTTKPNCAAVSLDLLSNN